MRRMFLNLKSAAQIVRLKFRWGKERKILRRMDYGEYNRVRMQNILAYHLLYD